MISCVVLVDELFSRRSRPSVGSGVGAGVGTGVGTGVVTGVGTGVGAGVGTGVGTGVGAGVGTWQSAACDVKEPLKHSTNPAPS